MNRVKLSLASALLLATGTATAELKMSLGSGVQYGGLLGYQAFVQSGKNNFRLALGFMGATAGYDYFITPKIALGVQTSHLILYTAQTLNLNYYFSPAPSSGFMLGIDVGRVNELDSSGGIHESNVGAFISIGHRF